MRKANDVRTFDRMLNKVTARRGRIKRAKAKEIVDFIKADGVTNDESASFSKFYTLNEDRMEKPAKAIFDRFFGHVRPDMTWAEGEAVHLFVPTEDGRVVTGSVAKRRQEPSLVDAHRGLAIQFAPIDGGELFVDGTSSSDVVQGWFSDCFVAATAAEFADLGRIESLFDERNGALYVKLYQRTPKGLVPMDVEITRNLPVYHEGLFYGQSPNPRELWWPLLEKAMTKAYRVPEAEDAKAPKKGSYHFLGRGGWPSWVMEMFTGRPATTLLFSQSDKGDALFEDLKLALKEKRAVVASSYGQAAKTFMNPPHTTTAKFKGTGIFEDHAYGVKRVFEKNGVKYVVLRNPWGRSEWTGKGADRKDDGKFAMPMREFMKYFFRADISG